MRSSLRLRLALWYAALLAVIIAITSVLSYSFHSTAHYEDIDRSLVTTAVHVVTGLRGMPGANPNLPPVEEFASPDIYVRLFGPSGNLVAESPNTRHQPEVDPARVASTPRRPEGGVLSSITRPVIDLGQPQLANQGGFLTVKGQQGRDRLYAVPVQLVGGASGYLEVGVSMNPLDQSLERLRLLLAAMSGLGLVAAILGGWAIAGSALRPVSTMAGTARAIALSHGFSRRLPDLGRRDELGQLSDTFNDMLASLDEAYRAQQRFVADASHELRTPLTSIQGNLELLDRAEAGEEDRVDILAHLRHETARMGRLVADLLVLARADAGQNLRMTRVEMDRLLLDVFKQARLMAGDLKVSIVEIDQLQVEGDPDRLKQLLLILVDNAIRYTPAGGEVRLGLRSEPGAAAVIVSDTGIGIEAEDLPHIFERFYRADKARARESGGTGLGLSIAKWIADSHGGSLSTESQPGRGSTFTLRLPLNRARPKFSATFQTPLSPD